MAGLVKVLLCMKYRTIPRHLHFNKLNPYIDLNQIPAVIPLENTEWKGCSSLGLVAGVSSFGLSGTNVHVILQEPPLELSRAKTIIGGSLERPLHIFVASAKSEKALEDLLLSYKEKIETYPDLNLADLAFSVNTTRAHFKHRVAVVVKDSARLLNKLVKKNYTAEKLGPDAGQNKIVFLFTGQGSQYAQMGKQLYESHPVFKKAFDLCSNLLMNNYGLDLKAILSYDKPIGGNPESNLVDSGFSQPAIFCIEYCLTSTWKSFGINPDFVLGHSVGEFAAAVCAGILSLNDGLKLVIERSKLVGRLDKGRMLVLRTSKDVAVKLIKEFQNSGACKAYIDIAAINSDEEVVVSGPVESIDLFDAFCKAGKVKTQMLAASHAFHSREMDKIIDDYKKIASTVNPKEAQSACRFVSGTTAREMGVSQFTPEYWAHHLRDTVDFAGAFKFLQNQKDICNTFIELGAQPVLLGLGMSLSFAIAQKFLWCPSLKKTEDNWVTLLTSLSKLYLNGCEIDWVKFDSPYQRRKLSLPNYPFQRERFWLKSAGDSSSMLINSKQIHPFIGRRVPSPLVNQIQYFSVISLDSLPFISDHKVFDKTIVPGASYLEAILAAGRDILTGGSTKVWVPLAIEDLLIEAALPLADPVQIQTVLTSQAQDGQVKYDAVIYRQTAFEMSGSDGGKWKKVASGTFIPCASFESPEAIDIEKTKARLTARESMDELYAKIAATGIQFGPLFKSAKAIWYSETEFLVETVLPEGSGKFVVHPIVFDAMIQASVAELVLSEGKFDTTKLYLPMSVNKCVSLARNCTQKLFIHLNRSKEGSSVVLFDEIGAPVAVLSGIELVQTTKDVFLRLVESAACRYPDFYEEVWQPCLAPRSKRGDWLALHEKDFETVIHKFSNDSSLDNFEGLKFFEMECISYKYILKTLVEFGLASFVADGEVVDVVKFAEACSVSPKHFKLFCRWFEVLEEEGNVEKVSGGNHEYRLKGILPSVDELNLEISLLSKDFAGENERNDFQIGASFGERLADLIQEKTSAFQLMFSAEADFWGAGGVYQSGGMETFHQRIAEAGCEVFKEALEASFRKSGSKDVTIRVLEVGAGTGSATKHFLEELTKNGLHYEYTFTDISPLFVKEASSRFSKYKNVRFQVLDIEKDPKLQGFPPHYYDCVVADNVLHATRDLNESVANVRSLLVPRGQIVLVELLRPFKLMDVTFGFLDGWWRFEDKELRPNYPTISGDAWVSLLEDWGFHAISKGDKDMDMPFGMIVGYLEEDEEEIFTPPVNVKPQTQEQQPVWLLFSNNDIFEDTFCRQLRFELESVGERSLYVYGKLGKQEVEIDNESYKVNPLSLQSYTKLMESLKCEGIPVKGVVYASGIETMSDHSDLTNVFGLLHLIQAMSNARMNSDLVVVTRGAQSVGKDPVMTSPTGSLLWGQLLTFRNEYPNQRAVVIDIDPEESDKESARDVCHQLWLTHENENRVAFRQNSKFIRRILPLDIGRIPPIPLPNSEIFELRNPESGSFDDFSVVSATKAVIGGGQVEVNVRSVALNFKDVLIVMGSGGAVDVEQLVPDVRQEELEMSSVGIDFAGIVTAVGDDVTGIQLGDRVYGLTTDGAFKSHVVVREGLLKTIPQWLSFEEASTLPCVFLTALYFLVDVGKLQSNDRLLIHVASGGVGLAAIQIAQQIGCEIFATAGSKRKRQYLRSLGIKYVYNSRNTDYGELIHRDTAGAGITIVLNALTGPNFKETTLSLCTREGRFLEMSRLNAWTHEEVKELRPDVCYFSQDTSQAKEKRDILGGILGDKAILEKNINIIQENLAKGKFRPLPYSRFTFSRVSDAFRYFQEAKHIGKVLVNMPMTNVVNGRIEHKEPIFNEYGTYLITGGFGGLGIEVAKWMASAGAKYLVLVGRKVPRPEAEAAISELRRHGKEILDLQGDVSDFEECQAIFDKIKVAGFPTLKGIMHAAGVLSDEVLAVQSVGSFEKVFRSKVQGTWNLHNLTNQPENAMDHFVLFSSVASVLGSYGQSNHSAANKFLDSFAAFRHSQGLPCTSINWGAWGEVGAAAELNLEGIGIRKFSPSQGTAALERIMLTQRQNCIVFEVAQWNILLEAMNHDSILDLVKVEKRSQLNSDEFEAQVKAILEAPEEERLELLKKHIEVTVRDVLRLPESEPIDRDQDFREMGIDSLMAMEMRNRMKALFKDYDRNILTIKSLQENRTVNKLGKLLADALNKGYTGHVLSAEELLELVKKDSILPENIPCSLKDCTPALPPAEVKTILLTGSTGQIGRFILCDLMKDRKDLQIYCLIRAISDESAKKRLENRLNELGFSESMDFTDVICIAGDVGKPKMGFSDEIYEQLVGKVDAVIHCAALVNQTLPYGEFGADDLRTNNVLGLLNVLKFVAMGKIKYLQYPSSMLAVTSINDDGTITEEFPRDTDFGVQSIRMGYALSKFICEKLLKEALEIGLPVVALRHHSLSGDSRTGVIPLRENHLLMFMLTCQKVKKVPSLDVDRYWTTIPADLAASISVQLFFKDSLEFGVYNIHNPNVRQISQTQEFFSTQGSDYDLVSYEKWREAAIESLSTGKLAALVEFHSKDLFSFEMFAQFEIVKNEKSKEEVLKLCQNSDRLKKRMPNIDSMMPDPFDQVKVNLMYYKNKYGEGNLQPMIDAALEKGVVQLG